MHQHGASIYVAMQHTCTTTYMLFLYHCCIHTTLRAMCGFYTTVCHRVVYIQQITLLLTRVLFFDTMHPIPNERGFQMNVNDTIQALKDALVYDAFVANVNSFNVDNLSMLVAVATGKAPNTINTLSELVGYVLNQGE